MSHSPRVSIQECFSKLTDPRRRKVVYPLVNVVTIAICAVLGGADDFARVEVRRHACLPVGRLRMTRGTVARSVANMSSAEYLSNYPIARDGLSWQPSAWRSCVLFGT